MCSFFEDKTTLKQFYCEGGKGVNNKNKNKNVWRHLWTTPERNLSKWKNRPFHQRPRCPSFYRICEKGQTGFPFRRHNVPFRLCSRLWYKSWIPLCYQAHLMQNGSEKLVHFPNRVSHFLIVRRSSFLEQPSIQNRHLEIQMSRRWSWSSWEMKSEFVFKKLENPIFLLQ